MTSDARRPELDSLRGLAILLVIASHAYRNDFVMGGPTGVAAFFALSGYLITGLLLRERDRSGRISLRGFYERRARRLLPALVVFLAVSLALGRLLTPIFATWHDALPVLFYVQNFSHMDSAQLHSMGHTWSLSVEEQFYIVFPLVLLALGRRVPLVRLPLVLSATAAALLGLRVLLWLDGASFDRLYYGTDSNAGLILVGAAAAAWCHVHGGLTRDLTGVLPALVGMLVTLGLVSDRMSTRTLVPVVAALVAVVALVVCHGRGAPRWLSPAWLVLVGRRSYGLYLWHYPLFSVVLPEMPDRWWSTVLLGAGAWLLTLMSWRFVEEPILAWAPRRRRARSPLSGISAQTVG